MTMTLSELGLKLFPFTSIDKGKVSFVNWENLTDGDKIITCIEIVLIIIFFSALIRLFISWWTDRRQILKLSKIIFKDLSDEKTKTASLFLLQVKSVCITTLSSYPTLRNNTETCFYTPLDNIKKTISTLLFAPYGLKMHQNSYLSLPINTK